MSQGKTSTTMRIGLGKRDCVHVVRQSYGTEIGLLNIVELSKVFTSVMVADIRNMMPMG